MSDLLEVVNDNKEYESNPKNVKIIGNKGEERNQIIYLFDKMFHNLIPIIKSKSLPSVKTSILKNHFLSTELGLNSQLNFVVQFVADIIESLLILIERKERKKRKTFVDLVTQLRCILMSLLFQKYVVEFIIIKIRNKIRLLRNDNVKNSKNNKKSKKSNENNSNSEKDKNENVNEKNDDDVTNEVEYCKIKLIEEFRNHCQTIIRKNEEFREIEEIKVLSTYLSIEILIAEISKKDVKFHEPKMESASNLCISKNIAHKLFSFLATKYMEKESAKDEFEFLTNFEGALSLFSITVFRISLGIPTNILHSAYENESNDYDNVNVGNFADPERNHDCCNEDIFPSNNKNENKNKIKNGFKKEQSEENLTDTKKQIDINNKSKSLTFLELENAARVIIMLAGEVEKNINLPKIGK